MNEKKFLTDTCSFQGVQPIMVDLPYPAIQVREKNQEYTAVLAYDYCGSVSEMSATMQYINNENRLSYTNCAVAKTILGIAMAEMIHMQKLGQLISLLGGRPGFSVRHRNGRQQMWTPEHLKLSGNAESMLRADIEDEKAAINQYRAHMRVIKDDSINAVLARIIIDEEYHIMILQALMNDL